MLFEGAVRFLQQAILAMENQDAEQRFDKLNRAGEIILVLQGALDLEQGGRPAQDLYEFYAAVDSHIRALHRSNDVMACEQIIIELRDMRDVWDTIDRDEQK